ncbi:MAG: MBL fold metallo-hydrolase [Gemmatimonadales bacterium]|jgi:glyoxylase-like metal-dependent hydrolase (beta-lactamase superfamily II)/rhodanese-related sulfurtransferase
MTEMEDFEITPTELAERLESGEDVQVLDVRAPHRLVSGSIEVPRFHNVPGSRIMSMEDPAAAGLDPDAAVAVVCAHGNSSQPVTHYLRRKGWAARSLRGGVAAWMNLLRRRDLTAPAGVDRFIQFDRVGKGALGYLIVRGNEALAVDPSRDWQEWREAAEAAGARLVGTADTHVHADFVSGSPALAATLDVPYYLHPDDSVYPYDGTPGRLAFDSIGEGDAIEVGGTPILVHHTPGHTEGSVSFRIGDDAILTGDFLFVGSIGRPDLAGKTEAWTGRLWDSLVRARESWPREATIYPAHYATDAERNEDLTVGRTLAELLAANPTLSIDSEAEFRARVESGISDPPDAYPIIKAINVGLRQASPLELEQLEAGKNECALG